MRTRDVIFVSAGSHASALLDILDHASIIGYTENENQQKYGFQNIKYLGNDVTIKNYSPSNVVLVNGLGMLSPFSRRMEIHSDLRNQGYRFKSIIHSKSIVSNKATLDEGVQIMAGAIVQNDAYIGANTIINTGSIVDHQSILKDNVHIAPGVTICGGVKVGINTFVGAGSTVLQNINVGKNVLIGAGSLVNKNIPDNSLAYGNPVRIIKKLK